MVLVVEKLGRVFVYWITRHVIGKLQNLKVLRIFKGRKEVFFFLIRKYLIHTHIAVIYFEKQGNKENGMINMILSLLR